MKKKSGTLRLSRETILRLVPEVLHEVAGGRRSCTSCDPSSDPGTGGTGGTGSGTSGCTLIPI